jgi:methionine biosynthesis protein MetW
MPVRIDYQRIEEHVADGARVLDLGCGDGMLLAELIERKNVRGYGVEIDEEQARACVARGVPVYHGDMMEGMRMFGPGAFDCVILSQTLQQTLRPREVMDEMLRVGRYAIVSFPNFGHWRVRWRLALTGRMPVTRTLPYAWYETPNIHLLTIRDFEAFCRDEPLHVRDRIFLSPTYRRVRAPLANLLAGMAIYVLEAEGRPDPGRQES